LRNLDNEFRLTSTTDGDGQLRGGRDGDGDGRGVRDGDDDGGVDWGSEEKTDEEASCEETETESEKKEISQPLVPPLFALPCGFEFPDCPICFDSISMVNVTVTTCGHVFHSSCVFEALDHGDSCPMCRNKLIDNGEVQDGDEEEDGDEDEDEDEEDDGDGDDDGDEDDDEDSYGEMQEDGWRRRISKLNLEQLTAKLTNMGYTMADIVKYSMLGHLVDIRSDVDEEKYAEDFWHKLFHDMQDLSRGRITMSMRDARSYAAVVGGNV